jgi:Integrase core domain
MCHGGGHGKNQKEVQRRIQARSGEIVDAPGRPLKSEATAALERVKRELAKVKMERFFATLKRERVSAKQYRTRDRASADIFDYIERFYNPPRRNSTIGYVRPAEYEKRHFG